MSSDIRLNSDGTLTDHDIGPHYPAGSFTNFNGMCEGYMWIAPRPINNGPVMYTADNLRQIADLLDSADAKED